ncbi:MAG TPA: membrane protein insertase YidC [Flavobacteriaceae bacterium]|nr:membrane protein insertase YidC [Flavobacteriaceae bacterium]MCB9212375.1 membrane protein insertase YidC [Alteromonas sp.]HPF11651.1 membrane protein insertase YidC [Flavobacteriaceae bacterium]HQU20126.1 membrane protein insertase YidC [Flavobacteriaceae bacterium]HQU64785.1 membrane protein insertase YidC [Flavobacteriaceae bacterium]
MEEKKFDLNSILGFVLIGGILLWMFYINKPTPEELEAEKAKTEQVEKETKAKAEEIPLVAESPEEINTINPSDSLALLGLQNRLGSFAYSGTLPSAVEGKTTTIENEVLELKVSNKGGYIVEAKLKEQTQFRGQPVYLIKDGNNDFNLQFSSENRLLNTRDLFFEPSFTKTGDHPVLSMKLKTSETAFIEYRYELKPGEYMLDFSINSQGLDGIINTSQPIHLDWNFKGYRQAKSIMYENRYTRLTYEFENGNDHGKLSPGGTDDETETNVSWMNFRQHFFSSMLLTDTPFKEVKFTSEDLAKNEEVDTVFTKKYGASMLLEPKGGGISYDMNMYYGPTDYQIFKKYDRNLDEAMPLGWGIFGIINKYAIIPVFSVLSDWFPAGIAIIVLTILFKLLLSPVQYKQYVSQAKLKVLKPELDEIKKKYEGNQMKIQQETLKLQNIAGASPLKGCLPALLQLPVFYALFTFFPTAFDLRQKSFLWADDLASFDVVANLPFRIPIYGNHISLFPILASIAIFIYMMMSTGQQMQQQQQPGMPNMKFLMYLSPLFMLVFFNNYASGLSLYYFTSNVITIGIMLVIKNFIIDEDKIHAKIQENKKKPKKQNRFQRKMAEMMEQAEQQKKAQQRKK